MLYSQCYTRKVKHLCSDYVCPLEFGPSSPVQAAYKPEPRCSACAPIFPLSLGAADGVWLQTPVPAEPLPLLWTSHPSVCYEPGQVADSVPMTHLLQRTGTSHTLQSTEYASETGFFRL